MSSTGQPLVTVVTPCYNAAPFIATTIASVREQDYPAIEHIIVDDCSTDGSWEVIEAHRDVVTCVRLQENRGGGYARNRGAEMARGDYLMFLDADDVIAPDTIRSLVDAARGAPGSIVFCDWARLRAGEGGWVAAPREIPLPAAGYDPLRGWLEGVWVPPCAVLWPREIFERTGGWDESLRINQDGDIMMRALADGAGLSAARGGCGYYRTHGSDRLTVSGDAFSESRLRSLAGVLEKMRADLEGRGVMARYREPLGVAYHRLALAAARHGHYGLAREYAQIGERYAGRRAVSRTRAGRLLTWILGVERKERLMTALARRGIATRARKEELRLRRNFASGGGARGPSAKAGGGAVRTGTARTAELRDGAGGDGV